VVLRKEEDENGSGDTVNEVSVTADQAGLGAHDGLSTRP